ncbi:MAG: hypothetical protein GXO18_06375 [Aquificae bacterium]|nr:hypothetical protein [Aquificota bacterium]
MTKGKKIAVGIATVPPVIYFSLFILTPLKEVFSINLTSPEVPDWVFIFAAFHFLMFLYAGLLWAFYMIHLFGDKSLSREKKALWALALVIGIVFTMPFYWFFRIWKAND